MGGLLNMVKAISRSEQNGFILRLKGEVAMNENEAIERIKYRMHTAGQVTGKSGMEDLEMAINAMKEIKQYRAIGTPEECRAAVEKQTAKRPRIIGNAMICPSCPRCFKSDNSAYCPSCGQMIDWE